MGLIERKSGNREKKRERDKKKAIHQNKTHSLPVTYTLKYSRINRGYYDKMHDMYAFYAIANPLASLSFAEQFQLAFEKLGHPQQTNWTLHAFNIHSH